MAPLPGGMVAGELAAALAFGFVLAGVKILYLLDSEFRNHSSSIGTKRPDVSSTRHQEHRRKRKDE